MKQYRWLMALVVGAMFIWGAALADALTNSIEWTGQGSDSLSCDKLGEGDFRTEEGWMHWVLTGAQNVTEAELVLGGTGKGEYAPTRYGSTVDFFTPYFEVDGVEATVYYAGSLARNSQFVLSDYCDPRFLLRETLVVTKTAEGLYDRTVEWDLEKSVSPEGPFSGEAGDVFPVEWTVVATKSETLSNYRVVGDITISNPTAPALVTFEVSDEIQGGFVADVTCSTYTVGLGDSVTCTYEASVPGLLDPTTLNIAVVTVTNVVWEAPYFGTVVGDEASAAVGEFKETLIGYDDGVLSDPRFKFEERIRASTTRMFPDRLVCSTEASDYVGGEYSFTEVNVATLNGNIGLRARAAVDLECVLPALVARKDADASYDRTVKWDLEKSVSPEGPFSGEAGDVFPVEWTVVATKSVTEDNFYVTGNIGIGNPAKITQTFTVADVLSGDGASAEIAATVECPSYTVAAGDSVTCKYWAKLPDASFTLNTATVTADGNEPVDATARVEFTENLIGYERGTLSDARFEYEEVIGDSTKVVFPDRLVCSTDASDYVGGEYSFTEVNVATLNGNIGLRARAEVTINCTWPFTDETAYADGGGRCFTQKWGWVNVIEPGTTTWPLWAGAGQCDTLKGTEVGRVTVVYDEDGYVDVTFTYFAGFSEVETHVYADYAYPPSYAPGQFRNEGPFDGSTVYVIAHAVVRGVFP